MCVVEQQLMTNYSFPSDGPIAVHKQWYLHAVTVINRQKKAIPTRGFWTFGIGAFWENSSKQQIMEKPQRP